MTTALKKPAPAPPLEPEARIQEITPEMATEWLAANTHNRPMRQSLVDQYARDMLAGRWHNNGEAIQLSREGVLLNGQHRLAAIAESGVAQQVLVVTNLDEEARTTIDAGAKRTAGDNLRLDGFPDGATLASVVKFAIEIETYPRKQNVRASNPEIVQLARQDEVLQWVVETVLPSLPKQLTTRTVMAYVYTRLHRLDAEACEEFFARLTNLDDLSLDSPILALHKKFAFTKSGGTLRDRVYAVSCFFFAWNAWRKGEARKVIKPYPNAKGYYIPPEPV